ncbi:MAG: hypothetical protein ACSLFI_10500 [Solirubrobacterales bacterium]
MPANRKLPVAKVTCRGGTCSIDQIRIRFNLQNKVYNGSGWAQNRFQSGNSVIVYTTIPAFLRDKLRPGRNSGWVSVVVTASSDNRTRSVEYIRTGLRR